MYASFDAQWNDLMSLAKRTWAHNYHPSFRWNSCAQQRRAPNNNSNNGELERNFILFFSSSNSFHRSEPVVACMRRAKHFRRFRNALFYSSTSSSSSSSSEFLFDGIAIVFARVNFFLFLISGFGWVFGWLPKWCWFLFRIVSLDSMHDGNCKLALLDLITTELNGSLARGIKYLEYDDDDDDLHAPPHFTQPNSVFFFHLSVTSPSSSRDSFTCFIRSYLFPFLRCVSVMSVCINFRQIGI